MEILNEVTYKEMEIMACHTTFRVGGPARYFFEPSSVEELKNVIAFCMEQKLPHMILGNGSNVLFTDDGYQGAIIHLYDNFNDISIEENKIYAKAGALLSKIANLAKDESLTGMEFAAGIPGTLGGAIVMNAGAYGGEMKDIVAYVDILMPDGSVKRFSGDEMEFSYRHSIVKEGMVVLGAGICLEKGEKQAIVSRMEELKEARVSKQPLEYPSAGSTFKRPEGYFAGKLIQDCELKGYQVGGAMVSTKHSGFVINYDHATASDILQLIEDVQKIVLDKTGVLLEPEVRIIR